MPEVLTSAEGANLCYIFFFFGVPKISTSLADSTSAFQIDFYLRNVDSPASQTVTFIWTVGSWAGGGAYFWVKIWRFLKLVGSCFKY